MIVMPSEIAELEHLRARVAAWNQLDDEKKLGGVPVEVEEAHFFSERPHLLLPLGFDEVRIVKVKGAKEHKPVGADWVESYGFDPGGLFEYELLYRESRSGAWYWFDGFTHFSDRDHVHDSPTYVHLVGPSGIGRGDRFEPIDDLLGQLRGFVTTPDPLFHTILLPTFWTPGAQKKQRVLLAEAIPRLLKALAAERISLREMHWRTLEEVVAELLRSSGLEIVLTPRAHDGGRDVIARGELIPGEPMTIAVEVKQKDIVGIEDLRNTRYANEDFPAVLLATSGEFSAGVIRERERERNQLRLVLKNGLALRQWIDEYARRGRRARFSR